MCEKFPQLYSQPSCRDQLNAGKNKTKVSKLRRRGQYDDDEEDILNVNEREKLDLRVRARIWGVLGQGIGTWTWA